MTSGKALLVGNGAAARLDPHVVRQRNPYGQHSSLPASCRRLAVLLPAARSIGCAMPDDKALRCDCGYEVTAADEAGRVEEIRVHAREAHGIAFSVEDALLVVLRSELEPSRVPTERDVRRSRAAKGGSS